LFLQFLWRWLLFGAGLCWLGVAFASHLPENSGSHAALTIASIDALELVSANSTLRSAQDASHLRYQPFDTHTTYPLNVDNALWLRIRLQVSAPIPANAWVLAMPKPFFDAVEIYTLSESPNSSGQSAWQMQTAGGAIAHQDWPIRSLSPQFYLPAMVPGSHEVYLKVLQDLPTRMSVSVEPIAQVFAEGQKNLLLVGLSLGIMLVMLVWSSSLALFYRVPAYGWYATYVSFALLFVASYTGFASYAFWPEATRWSRHCVSVLAIGAVAMQLQFTRALFLPLAKWRWLHRLVSCVIALSWVAMVLYYRTDSVSVQLTLLALTLPPGLVLMVLLGVRALRDAPAVARLWLLAYVPIMIVLTLTLVELLGIAPLAWLNLNAPVYALVFEVPVLLIALHLHAKSQRDNEVRERTLAETDPLTGFATQEHFQRMLSVHWTQYKLTGQDMALAYIRLVHQPHQDYREELQRVVRQLRTIARRRDIVAHMGGSLFGILMPQTVMDDALSSRFSRLVALGLMVDPGDPHLNPIGFRIALGTFQTGALDLESFNAALLDKINQPNGWKKRSIRYVTRLPQRTSDMTDMGELWETALEQAHPGITKRPPKSLP
jgi:hypothetical protein